MQKQMNAIRILIFLLAPLCVLGQAPQWSTDTTVIRLGEPITVEFVAFIHADSTARFPNYSTWEERSFVVVHSDSFIGKPKSNTVELKQTVVVTSFDTGFAVLEPVVWQYDGVEYESDPTMIEVRWVLIEEGESLFDIKGVLSVAYPWYVYVLIVLLLVLLVLLVRFVLRRIRRPALAPALKPEQTPYEWVCERMNILRASDLWSREKYGLFFLELTTILRQYMERVHGIRAMEATHDELVERIQLLPLTDEQRRKVILFFQHAELVKYAKQNPFHTQEEHYLNEADALIEWLNSAKGNVDDA